MQWLVQRSIIKKLLHQQSFLRRQCAVVGPAVYHKKFTSLDCHKKNYITDTHFCGGNVRSLVWRSIIKKITRPAVMLAEAMCSGWSGGAS